MAKKPGPVAGSLGNTEYYYKSDGTVVDESGIPASARISAMFAAPPVVEAVAIKKTQQKLKKNNAQLAGVLKNTKYYFAPDGSSIVDDRGLSAPAPIAKAFLKDREEKRQSIAAAMAYTTSTFAPKQTVKETESKVRTEKFNNILVTSADKLNASNDEMNKLYPVLFKNLNSVIARISENHEILARQLVEQNQNFQDAVVEQLTGAKGPTKSGGSSGKRAKGAKGIRGDRTKYVKDRAERINAIRQEKNKKALGVFAPLLGGLIAAGTIALTGAGNDKSEITPDVPRGAAGGGPPVSDYNGPGVSATGSAREAIAFFESKGWTKAQAIGIAANLEVESKFKTSAVGDGGKAYGIAQWHPDRQRKFKETYGKDIRESNFQEQLEYVNWELNNKEKRAGAMIRQTQTAASAAAAVDEFYERSSGAHRQIRINLAEKYARGEGLAAQTTPTAPAAPPSDTNRSVGNIAGPSVPANLSVQPTLPAGQPSRIGAIQPSDATGAPQRRPSATPEEATTHQANVGMLKNINDLAAKKGPGARLGEANEAKKKELEEKITAFNQKFSIRPMQQAGVVTPLIPGSQPGQPAQVGAVRPLDTTGVPSHQQVLTSLASLGNGGNIKQAQSGIRKLPISDKLNSVLQQAARSAGVDVTVTSGGQPAFPQGPRTGSKRHDLGDAADLDLYVGGRILTDSNPMDVELKKKFVSAATAAGASGVGAGYMGPTKIHVGFGTSAKWGGAPWLGGITPGSGAGVQTASLGPLAQRNAMAQNINSMPCPPMIFNNIMNNNAVRTILQGSSFQQTSRPNPGFNPLAAAIGGVIGNALRGLF